MILGRQKSKWRGRSVYYPILTICIMLIAGCGESAGDNTEDAEVTDGDGSGTVAGEYLPKINPADFSVKIDNKYFPLVPGKTYVYEGEADGEKEINEVMVKEETKQIMGVTCVVVSDKVSVEGEVVEETLDWYAQDKNGDVWYFGEDSKDFEDGKLTGTEGSWEAGRDGAQPGIIMKAGPRAGESWRQEYYPGVAEDMAEVLEVGESITVGAGSYQGCVRTRDFSPLEPDVAENKLYCPEVGVVMTEMVKGGSDRTELVRVQ